MSTQLIDRIVESVKEEQAFIHLARIVDPLRCVRFPPANKVRVSRLRETPAHCRILGASDPREFRYAKRDQWAPYEEIAAAYGHGASHIRKLPKSIVDAPAKLVIADRAARPWSFVTAERVYPRRAWVGALAPGWDIEMAFVVAAIMNSAIGHVLYARTAQRVGIQGQDLAKGVLEALPIPVPALQPQAFSQLALLSYRLHQLYDAQEKCKLDLASLIRDHWLYLLPQVVKLYGWSEVEARLLLLEAPQTRDQAAGQDDLFSVWPQTPLRAVRLLDECALGRYEELKSRTRAGTSSPDEATELARLSDALYWEERVNGGLPARLSETPWPGAANEQQAVRVAYGHLSRTRGQRFRVETPVRHSDRIWEVPISYLPPRRQGESDPARLAEDGSEPGKHPAGMLYVDAITGSVSDTLERAQHAIATQPG